MRKSNPEPQVLSSMIVDMDKDGHLDFVGKGFGKVSERLQLSLTGISEIDDN